MIINKQTDVMKTEIICVLKLEPHSKQIGLVCVCARVCMCVCVCVCVCIPGKMSLFCSHFTDFLHMVIIVVMKRAITTTYF